MKLAEGVRTARRLAGLSQRELARRAGVPQSTVARIELETIEPRSSTVEKVLSAAGYEIKIEPRLGDGVDRTLIRRFLGLTPKERIEYAVAGGELARRLRAARANR
jgi:predicted transcriptional regulator